MDTPPTRQQMDAANKQNYKVMRDQQVNALVTKKELVVLGGGPGYDPDFLRWLHGQSGLQSGSIRRETRKRARVYEISGDRLQLEDALERIGITHVTYEEGPPRATEAP